MHAHSHSPKSSVSCPHCGALAVRRPSPLWRLAVVPAWIVSGLMVLGAGMIGPFILVVVPLLFAGGVGLLSTVHAQASAPPECEACGKIAIRAVGRVPAARAHAVGGNAWAA